jgi:hypothetical protein
MDSTGRPVTDGDPGELHRDRHPARTLRLMLGVLPSWIGDAIRMSQLSSESGITEQSQLSKICVSIRGKLQFMDYLVRAALADAERYQAETDPGTQIFIRQLVEMHVANLRLESENMSLVSEVCAALESMVDGSQDSFDGRDLP